MEEAKVVWVIESGCYSDYSVDGIYSTREKAEAAMSRMRGGPHADDADNPRINEWKLDEEVATDDILWRITFLDNGNTLEWEPCWENEKHVHGDVFQHEGDTRMFVYVSAATADKAHKIAVDIRRRKIAERALR